MKKVAFNPYKSDEKGVGRSKNSFLFWSLTVLLIALLGVLNTTETVAQCSGSAPVSLALWNFNSKTVACNGAKPKPTDVTAPQFRANLYTYCPNTNNGCGQALLGSKGHLNSQAFSNGLCLSNFYNSAFIKSLGGAAFNPKSTTFDPNSAINLAITYQVPAGKAGCLTDFGMQILQKQFNGTTVNFEKQGVAVKKNGVIIYNETQNILASNINATPMSFAFTGPEFCWDGSTPVTYEIIFGLVYQFGSTGPPGSPATTGYDNIALNGVCGESPKPVLAITPATCGTTGANSNGKITLSNFGATDRFDFVADVTYSGNKTYATATAIPVGGILTSALPNPTTPEVYSVRIFRADGCTEDLQITLDPTFCAIPCPLPSATVNAISATCVGTSPASNASVTITGISGGNKVGLSVGTSYTGPSYSSAFTQTGGTYTFSNLANPIISQNYVVRVFNGEDGCFKDFPVTILEKDCGCKKIGAEIISSDQKDPNSSPNNGNSTEDDFVAYEVCKSIDFIDLKITKTVSPSSGTTCPTNTSFVWTVIITNEGTMAATNIQVVDSLPEKLIQTAFTVTAGEYGQFTGWLLPSLAAGASQTLTLTTYATEAGTYENCAWINSAYPLNDPDSSPLNDKSANEDDDACAVITVTGPSVPTIAKEFSPLAAKPGTPVRLTIKINNNELTPITLTSTFVDILPSSPAQMTISSTPNVSVNNATPVIAAAGSNLIFIPNGTAFPPGLTQIQVDVVASAEGTYCNILAPGALKTSSCSTVDSTVACVEFNNNYIAAPLIKKAFMPAIVQTNQNSTLTLTVENRNTTPITTLQDFKDVLPTGLIIAGPATGTCPNISTFSSVDEVGITQGAVIQPGSCIISFQYR